MLDPAHIDFETRSCTDLRASGVYRYVEDTTTAPWGFSYRFGKGEVRRWRPGDPQPTELLCHIAVGGIVMAHNAAFERNVWNGVLVRWYPDWPSISVEQQVCTMARAAATSHPQDLDTLCNVLDTPHKKDRDGHALMIKMSRPRRYNADGTITWWDEPENVDRLLRYCDTDIFTECDVDDKLPALTPYETEVWRLDQKINDRGIYVGHKVPVKAALLVELAKKAADKEMRMLTGRAVPKCSNDGKIVQWIQQQGIECTTVKKGVQDDLLFLAGLHELPVVRDVIKLRADSKKTSTAKYSAMTECVCADGRIRGLLNYHGAGPGRWAGRLVQPQNFPRVDTEKEGHVFEWLAELLESDMDAPTVFEMMTTVHGEVGDNSPLRLMSRFLRSVIKAAPGNKLVGGDFSNIEGRINAWFAGEEWKLQAFRDQDAGTGDDLYCVTASGILYKPVAQIDKVERQSIGKTSELACGFQGSVAALLTMAANYNVDAFEMSKVIKRNIPANVWDETAAEYASASNKSGLEEREWTALKTVINGWRQKNPRIVQSWWDLQDAAIEAVAAPGTVVKCLKNRITYYSDERCLWCFLPSSRAICYSSPQMEFETVLRKRQDGSEYETTRRKVSFWGYKEGRWRKLYLYGGLQCENIVQGTARCVMVDRMFDAERRGYPIILTVHDELLAEVPLDRLDLNERDFKQIMSVVPSFVEGLPLTAKAWEDQRYVK